MSLKLQIEQKINEKLNTINVRKCIDTLARALRIKLQEMNIIHYTSDKMFDITLDKVIDNIKIYTSCFQKTLIITDTYTSKLLFSRLENIVIRGGVCVITLDLLDVRDVISKKLVVECQSSTELVENIEQFLELSEVIEDSIVVRLPIYCLEEVDTNVIKPSKQVERPLCPFYRHWRVKNAWKLTREFYISIKQEPKSEVKPFVKDLVLSRKVAQQCREILLVDFSLGKFVENLEVENPDVVFIKAFHEEAFQENIREILAKCNRVKVLTTSSKIVQILSKFNNVEIEHVDVDVNNVISQYVNVFKQEGTRRLSDAILMKLLSLFTDLNVIILKTYPTYIMNIHDVQGKYDTRIVLEVPRSVYDVGDFEISHCNVESMKYLEEKLPLEVIPLCVISDINKISLRDLLEINKLRRSKFVLVLNYREIENIRHLFNFLNIKHVIIDLNYEAVYKLRQAVLDPDVKLIILKYARYVVDVVPENCDLCGDCLGIDCGAISITSDGKVRINYEKCDRCLACIVVCTRGVFYAR